MENAERRRRIRGARRFLCGWLGLGLAAAAVAAEDEPAMLVLQYQQGGQVVRIAIPPKTGAFPAPNPGKPREKWRIVPGPAVASNMQPPERTVELFQGSGAERISLCAIRIRYYRGKDGSWAPHFQLIEEPLFIRDGDRWKPLTTPGGAPNLIVLTSASLPNAEGFYPWLEFGLSSGPAAIDAWVVR